MNCARVIDPRDAVIGLRVHPDAQQRDGAILERQADPVVLPAGLGRAGRQPSSVTSSVEAPVAPTSRIPDCSIIQSGSSMPRSSVLAPSMVSVDVALDDPVGEREAGMPRCSGRGRACRSAGRALSASLLRVLQRRRGEIRRLRGAGSARRA
jgi:hypothetical protein